MWPEGKCPSTEASPSAGSAPAEAKLQESPAPTTAAGVPSPALPARGLAQRKS